MRIKMNILGVVKGKIFTLLYRLYLRLFVARKIEKQWRKAMLNSFNKNNETVNCFFCGSNKGTIFHKTKLDGIYLGLFDNDLERLNFLYGVHIEDLSRRNLYFDEVKKIVEKQSFLTYLKCGNCGLIYQNYPHEQKILDNYYNTLYRSIYSDTGNAYGRGAEANFMERKGLITDYFLSGAKLSQQAKVLDIGCAEGIVCHILKKAGMVPYGIDPCEQEVKYARNYFKLDNIVLGNYGVKTYPEAYFDGIITHHVLEHIFNIGEAFAAMSLHLKPGGYLLIQCPRVDEGSAHGKKRLMGAHVVGYTREFLVNILKKDFELIEILETPYEPEPDFPWLYLGTHVSKWGDVKGGISLLAKKNNC